MDVGLLLVGALVILAGRAVRSVVVFGAGCMLVGFAMGGGQ